jgi:DNA-binding PadR family transcriptional regulator
MPARGNRQRRIEPIRDSEFHILLALADGERHGYGIMQEVEKATQGTIRLGPGTLYGTIRRLLAAGLIEESTKRPVAAEDDERRRCYYRVTKAGRTVAENEARRLAELVRVARSKRLLTWRQAVPGRTVR